jgi:HAMP domain-containing protein
MNIRTQSLLVIVPVFVGLGLAIGSLVCFFELNETRWALRQEVSAYAASVAELADPVQVRWLLDGREGAGGRLRTALEQVARLGRVQRLSVGDPSLNRLVLDVGRGSGRTIGGTTGEPVEVNSAQVSFGGHAATGDIAIATRQVLDEGGEWVGTVRAEVDASPVASCWLRCRERLLNYAVIGLLVGVACALFICQLVLGPLHALDRAARRAVAGGLEDARVRALGRIREMNDLGNAFNTLVSMLEDAVKRMRRSVYGDSGQQLESRAGRDAVDEQVWEGGNRESGDTDLDLVTVGGGRGAFGQFVSTRGITGAVIGRMPPGPGLNAALDASACVAYLTGALTRSEPSRAVEEAVGLFGPLDLRLIVCDGESAVQSCHFEARTGTVTTARATVAPGEVRVYHNLGEQADRRIQLYAGAFCAGSSGRTADELLTIVGQNDPNPHGALLVVSRVETAGSRRQGITINAGENDL